MEHWTAAAISGVFGLVFGSFGNVAIHRIPGGESVVRPPSACPRCGTQISARDNIPVLSWLLLRGRCRHCDQPISPRYPLVELGMGVVFFAVGWRVGLDWALPGFLLFAWMLVIVAVIDAYTRKVPNRLTYPLIPALLGLMVAAAFANAEPGWALRSFLGGLAAFGAMLSITLISPRGMGMGDVKLAAFIGIGLGYLGWGHVVLGIFGAFLIGGVIAIGLLVTRLRRRRDPIPFGPYLSLSAILTLLAGQPVITWYAGLLTTP
jgi:leader peptidase (prepilin peptidase) / N-methyltransferase